MSDTMTDIYPDNQQERFDYTEWSQNLFEDMTLEELHSKAAEFEREHPELIGKGTEII
jgi:hypothetical protein